mgnify:CR=1
MIAHLPPLLIVLIVLGLGFDFFNGVNDSSNIVATMISSRAIRPKLAMFMTAMAEFCGPFLFGVAVATTIGNDIVDPQHVNMIVLITALTCAILWNFVTRFLGIPSSTSHALIGGILGAVVMNAGFQVVKIAGLAKILIALFVSPIAGLLAGLIIANITYLMSWNATPSVNGLFKRLQVITSLGLALSHGTNDSQKTMGIITLGLVTSGVQSTFHVPFWVVFVCAMAIALGTSIGSWKLIRTLGTKFYRVRPVHGFTAQASSAVVILAASLFGGPVSTTQVVSAAIMGVGAADRVNKVRWGVAGEIASAWLLTIPATALVSAGIYWLLTVGFPKLIALF